MVRLTNLPINSEALRQELLRDSPSLGGVVIFEGRVRNHSAGKSVAALTYECYEPMALKVMEDIREEALKKWEVGRIIALHRHGHIPWAKRRFGSGWLRPTGRRLSRPAVS